MPNFFIRNHTITFMITQIRPLFVIVMVFSLFSMGFSELSFGDNLESPRKQLERGINPENIMCKPGYQLVIFHSDKPACVSPTTVLKLEERGYIKSVLREFVQETIEIKDSSIPPNVSTGSTISGNTGTTTAPQITNIPASPGSIVNFYIADDDLNINRNGVDVIETSNVLQFFINGVPIKGPDTMIETGPTTGEFFVRLQLPDSVNGKPISQDDIVEIRYLDESDAGGEQRISVKSIPLSQTYAQVQTSGGGKTRIGHEFTVRIYEPDANLDSKDVDRIPLSRLEYRGEGGIRTTLNNPVFDANSSFLRETGDNSGIFEVIIKIPRTVDGKTIHIGDWYELRYVDISTPSNTSEEIKLKGKIG